MKKIATYSFLGAFFLLNLLDIIITIMVKTKHKVFNEVNIIYNLTGSITLMFIIKWIFVFLVIAFFLFKYPKVSLIVRYGSFIFTLIIILLFVGVLLNNYYVYKLSVEHEVVSVQMNKEELVEYGQERVGKVERFNVTYLIVFCIVSFALFQRIEKENVKETKTS